MRVSGNFHPEWGYLAPAPNFMRTARMVVVATAIGATAGAAVVLSLVDRPAMGSMADAGGTLVVVHSLVQPAEAAVAPTSVVAPVAAVTPAPETAPAAAVVPAPAPQVTAKISAPAPSEARAISTPAAPATVAALAESPPATETLAPGTDTVTANSPKVATAPATKKLPATATTATGQPQAQHTPSFAPTPKKKTAGNDGLAPILRRLFSAN